MTTDVLPEAEERRLRAFLFANAVPLLTAALLAVGGYALNSTLGDLREDIGELRADLKRYDAALIDVRLAQRDQEGRLEALRDDVIELREQVRRYHP